MNHADHVALLAPGIPGPGGQWADLGAGSGAFTLALHELLGSQAVIYAVDRERAALKELARTFRQRFGPDAVPQLVRADFAGPLDLPALDGVVMANSLHFSREKLPVLQRVGGMLKPGGKLLVVEYNVRAGNQWVPFPIPFEQLRQMTPEAGLTKARLLAKRPSSFLHEFYSAEAIRQPDDGASPHEPLPMHI